MAAQRDDDERSLFDLPLTPDEEDDADQPARPPAAKKTPRKRDDGGLPLFSDDEGEELAQPDLEAPESTGATQAGDPGMEAPQLEPPDAEPPDAEAPDRAESGAAAADAAHHRRRAEPLPAPFTHRLTAALLDGGVLLTCTALALIGAHLLGVRWDTADLPALGLFLAVFTFVYSVVPLAFWGRTPGMALARVIARGADGGPLTFGQTALRWLAGVLTLALAGLPFLLALAGRSPADLLSGSRTWLQPPSPRR